MSENKTASEIAQEADRHRAEVALLKAGFIASLEGFSSGQHVIIDRAVLAEAVAVMEKYWPGESGPDWLTSFDALRKAIGQ